jgi:hypothetical protein
MQDQTIEYEAKIYVYDLHNCAREFGFRADEKWEVNMVTEHEKAELIGKYFPTLSVKVLPEMLTEMLNAVKSNLSQQLAGIEKALDTSVIRQHHFQYLVAYNPIRLRR